jgi:hypothetical protein
MFLLYYFTLVYYCLGCTFVDTKEKHCYQLGIKCRSDQIQYDWWTPLYTFLLYNVSLIINAPPIGVQSSNPNDCSKNTSTTDWRSRWMKAKHFIVATALLIRHFALKIGGGGFLKNLKSNLFLFRAHEHVHKRSWHWKRIYFFSIFE